MFYKAHVMAGLNARHGEERHSLTGALQRAFPWSIRDTNLHGSVGHPLPVTVDLMRDRKDKFNMS